MERMKEPVPRKDLEVAAAVRVFNSDRLVAHDRHFDQLKEYRTLNRMVEEFGVRPLRLAILASSTKPYHPTG
jgi:hypothetical protein